MSNSVGGDHIDFVTLTVLRLLSSLLGLYLRIDDVAKFHFRLTLCLNFRSVCLEMRWPR